MNLLLDHSNGLLKIGDFGSAKVIHKVAKSTAYQVTDFYGNTAQQEHIGGGVTVDHM